MKKENKRLGEVGGMAGENGPLLMICNFILHNWENTKYPIRTQQQSTFVYLFRP